MNLLNIILGIIAAALLFHFRSSYLLAQKQLLISARLRSYLLYWNSWILENDFFSVFYLGIEWNKEIDKLLAEKGSTEDLIELKNQKRKMIDDIKKAIESDDSIIDLDVFQKYLKLLSDNTTEEIMKYSRQYEEDILNAKTFISDDDSSILGIHYAHVCVNLKMNLITMVNLFTMQLCLFIRDPDTYSPREFSKDISEIVWRALLVSKDIDHLTKRIDSLSKRSVLDLTWSNIRGRL